jgi:ligand-binding sensor domain-containing protein/signal transduction histidine kinase/DNA-binding response OmpR family regulator
MKVFPVIYSALIIFIYLIAKVHAQDIRFERISVEEGLSAAAVKCILQDSRGFMWIGTEDGLNKYDGYTFSHYRNNPGDSLSLSNSDIRAIFEDQHGMLWIGTGGGGLNRFDSQTEQIVVYNYDSKSLNCDFVQEVGGFRYNEDYTLWIGTCMHLVKYDCSMQAFTWYPPTEQPWPNNFVEAMVIDDNGGVWIGCPEGGLHYFDPETEKFIRYQHDPENPKSISSNHIRSLLKDRSGNLWIGTMDGLNKFDPQTGKVNRYYNNPEKSNSLSSNQIRSLFEDQSGVLWIGTHNGLNKYDPKTGNFTHYINNPNNPQSISSNFINAIYEDRSGVLWIGTDLGLNKIAPQKIQFNHYWQDSANPKSLYNKSITSIYGSSHGGREFLWMGTRYDGIYRINRKTGEIVNYRHDPTNPNSLSHNWAGVMLESRFNGKEELWIHTHYGLNNLNPATGQFAHFVHNPDDSSSINGDVVNEIYEDRSGILWVTTRRGGLQKLDRATGKFTQVGGKRDISQVYEDTAGNFWIAGWGPFTNLDRETEQISFYWPDPDNRNHISHYPTLTIYEDKSGRLWIGTHTGGLYQFDHESKKFYPFTTADGLHNNVIKGILEDNHGNLWLSTNNGLSKFDPDNITFTNYDVADGLLSNQFNHRSCYRSNNGELFFGNIKGFDAFYPDSLEENRHIPAIVLTDFQLFNKSVAIQRTDVRNRVDEFTLSKHFSSLDKIELSYKENIFSFEFAALDYRSPEKNRYAYMLEGFESDWNYTGYTRRHATYTNLDPGEYTFRVKGSNNDGLWNEEGTSIKVIITPPWWATNPAYFTYILLLVAAVFAIWRVQINRLKMKYKMEINLLQTEKLQEVDRMKSRFFANISHDFRTPLTLIKGPVKQMLQGKFAGNVKEQYKMILRNSDRLLGLINQILDLSKLESGEIKLKVVETNIIKYLKGMVLSFASLAESRKVTLKFSSNGNSLMGYVDRDKLEKIVTNLLSNAFKFTPERGKIVVNLSTVIPAKAGIQEKNWIPHQVRDDKSKENHPNIVKLTVSNTGSGIPREQLDKIFDRFYQADDAFKKDSEGSGIGLALTKELVEVCHGEINVRCQGSEPNAQTIFTVLLPIDKGHLKPEEVVEEFVESDRKTDLPLRRGIKGDVSLQHSYEEIDKSENKLSSKTHKSFPLLLIVEDNPDVTSYISSFMDRDYRILTTENGKEGLKKTIDKYPDLIISDVMMPEMDGFELCKRIKTDERISHIPVILLTAKADLESKLNGLEFGADDYITKPFEARELQIRSKNLIEQRKKLREKFSALIDLNPADIAASSMDEQLLQRLLAVFEEHMEEPEFSIEQLAREIGMSRRHLNRKIQAITNLSTTDFIRTLRLQRAAGMLRNASGTISEIAYKVGFNNLSYFSRAFRKQFGRLPSEFPKKQ